jgi:hypothetical protein
LKKYEALSTAIAADSPQTSDHHRPFVTHLYQNPDLSRMLGVEESLLARSHGFVVGLLRARLLCGFSCASHSLFGMRHIRKLRRRLDSVDKVALQCTGLFLALIRTEKEPSPTLTFLRRQLVLIGVNGCPRMIEENEDRTARFCESNLPRP